MTTERKMNGKSILKLIRFEKKEYNKCFKIMKKEKKTFTGIVNEALNEYIKNKNEKAV